MKVDREAVKVLALAIGVREAARKLNLNENTVVSWSKRDNWFPNPQPILSPKANGNKAAISAIKPSEALVNILAEDNKRTKIGFSRAARKAAEHVADMADKELVKPATALAAKSWHSVAESVHGWNKDDPQASPLNLQVLSQNTVISIGDKGTASVDSTGE